MDPKPDHSITKLLEEINAGDRRALDELLPLIMGELRRMAEHNMNGQRRDHTLQASALVNEAFIKLFGRGAREWRNRSHLLALFARTMRHILTDHARSKSCAKRLPEGERVAFEELSACYEERAYNLVDLDDALEQMAAFDATMASIVELRFFGGLTIEAVARALGLSVRQVEKDLETARRWLRKRLR